jgi:hypothetical protein
MVRPSILQRAESCGLVPALAEQYPETSNAADNGTAIHAAIARDDRSVPEAKAAREWVESNLVGELIYERKAALVDLETMEVLTEGTPDLVSGPDTDDTIAVTDWKTGQPDNVAEPDANLQLIAYGLAVSDGRRFRCVIVFLHGGKADARWSRIFEPDEHAALQGRISSIVHAEPIAKPGEHCQSCYQRVYCPAWKARVETAMTVLPAESRTLTVTDGNAGELSVRIKAVREAADLAESALRAHVLAGGCCVVDGKELCQTTSEGRESADAKALREAGLTQYLKQGAPFTTWRWRKVK